MSRESALSPDESESFVLDPRPPSEAPHPRPDPLPCVIGVYLAVTLVGLALVWVRGGWVAVAGLAPGRAPAESLAWGLLIAVVTLALTAPPLAGARWMRRLGRLVRRFFAPITPGRAVVVGIASAVGEEVFFRGALQPWFGLPVTSVLFGALHVLPPIRRNWPWSVFAVVLGLGLGWAFERTESLLGPILAHALINAVNLHRCGRR